MTTSNDMKKEEKKRRSDKGVALLIVLVMLAILGALTADFAYNTQLELEAAANGRDQLQAEYLAKSSVQFAQALITLQTQQAGVLSQVGKQLGIPLDNMSVVDFAQPLMKIVFGTDPTLLPKNASLELEIIPEDGKFGLSCSGGLNPDPKQQLALYQIIQGLFRLPLHSQNFYTFLSQTNAEGLQLSRENIATWLIDWMDFDQFRYNPVGTGSGAEEKYDRSEKPYEMHNHYLDTIDEIALIHGMEQRKIFGFFHYFFTPYTSKDCRISLAGVTSSSWPLLAAALVSSADPTSSTNPNLIQVAKQLAPLMKTLWPVLRDKSIKEISQMLAPESQPLSFPSGQTSFCPQLPPSICPPVGTQTTTGQTPASTPTPPTTSTTPTPTPTSPASTQTVSKATTNLAELLCSPLVAKLVDANQKTNLLLQGGPPPKVPTSPLQPLSICPTLLEQFIKVPDSGTVRRFYRIKAEGLVSRGNQKETEVKIDAVWDSQNINSHRLCSDPKCNTGAWIYYRLE